ncbi:MAG: protein phosphatase 2C domain-containing protein [Caldilineaceae bacterium]|nr:protein phosphatase 2C domain-containing protein [Caldilineaceae bacterium]
MSGQLAIRIFWLPKAGNQEHEYEDACWPVRSLLTARPAIYCAVADGATETSFSGLWARQLVQRYGAGELAAENLLEALAPEQSRWLETVQRRPLPWYAEEKVRSGAFAALLGVQFEQAAEAAVRWSALAVGDCNLVQVRENGLLCSFPAAGSDFFTSRPVLISSNSARNSAVAEHLQTAMGMGVAGDRFYLMTDALAQWFLGETEAGRFPWQSVDQIAATRGRRAFIAWIEQLREQGALRNDDVTLVRVELLPQQPVSAHTHEAGERQGAPKDVDG